MTDSKPVPKQQKYLERDQESILPTNEIVPSVFSTCSNSWQEDPEQGLELPIYRLKTKTKIELSVPLWPAQ